MTLAMLGWTFLWPAPDLSKIAPADAIMCLGAGMDASGTLDHAALRRVERCVELYDAGLAPTVVFSGGVARSTGPSAAHQMGLYAQSLGLPVGALVEEGRAQSTLQNALFSLDLVPDAMRIIVVTEAFHLPRAWASFRWASFETGMPAPVTALVMSENVRPASDKTGVSWTVLIRESIAIWFNAARALAYSVLPNPSVDWLH